VLVVTRHRVGEAQAREFLQRAGGALDVLQRQPGFQVARITRSLDDGALWMLHMEWSDVGFYRRALTVYDVRVHAVPLLGTALDEPTAYEVLEERHAGSRTSAPTRRAADADEVGLGEAAMPAVPTDFD
jgi:Antibiotic biosynthesis monooxygenase